MKNFKTLDAPTPKSLRQAIENALIEIERDHRGREMHATVIKWHVMDFLAQKFGPQMLKAKTDEISQSLFSVFDSCNKL